MDQLQSLLEVRTPFYRQAEIEVDTHGRTPEECTEVALAALNRQDGHATGT